MDSLDSTVRTAVYTWQNGGNVSDLTRVFGNIEPETVLTRWPDIAIIYAALGLEHVVPCTWLNLLARASVGCANKVVMCLILENEVGANLALPMLIYAFNGGHAESYEFLRDHEEVFSRFL